MDGNRIYFDNAATSFPKPEPVIQAMVEYLNTCGNPGRGAHDLALAGARTIFSARESIADFLGIKSSERLIFTPGCTASINMVVKGLALQGFFQPGDVVVTTAAEHNAVMRPLEQLRRNQGVVLKRFGATGRDAEAELEAILEGKAPVKLAFFTAASNVTGETIPLERLNDILKRFGVPLAVDGAQTVGKLDYDLSSSSIAYFCASGHKGLQGPPGVGLLYVAPGFDLEPIISGGTGSRSESLAVPGDYPDHLEAGTLPGPAIAGLAAGTAWMKGQMQDVLKRELALTEQFLSWTREQSAITVYGYASSDRDRTIVRMPVVSFNIAGHTAASIADRLNGEFRIAVRAGLHCASLMHDSLGTLAGGTVRVSFGPFNTSQEVMDLCQALAKITG